MKIWNVLWPISTLLWGVGNKNNQSRQAKSFTQTQVDVYESSLNRRMHKTIKTNQREPKLIGTKENSKMPCCPKLVSTEYVLEISRCYHIFFTIHIFIFSSAEICLKSTLNEVRNSWSRADLLAKWGQVWLRRNLPLFPLMHYPQLIFWIYANCKATTLNQCLWYIHIYMHVCIALNRYFG